MKRRTFLRKSATLATLAGGLPAGFSFMLSGCADESSEASQSGEPATAAPQAPQNDEPLFRISLAEWSLHRQLRSEAITNLDFPVVARERFGIHAIEYVNSFFKDKARDEAYLSELKSVCDGEGVESLIIMCDGEGALGDPDAAGRTQAVENHHRWVEAAKFLGCHAIRVNAQSDGTWEEQRGLAADGLRRLTEFGAEHEIGVIVENHGGLSSNGQWLAEVMDVVDHPNCGTLPDFGNFNLGNNLTYDRYQGVTELMPYAKAVSAKSHDFGPDGFETHTDYMRMLRIVLDAGYRGFIGVEYEGSDLEEDAGITTTKVLLERCRDALVSEYS